MPKAEITPLPSAMVFYAAGVRLTTQGSPVLDSLRQLLMLPLALSLAMGKIVVAGLCPPR